jgi:hypothetical protein
MRLVVICQCVRWGTGKWGVGEAQGEVNGVLSTSYYFV